MLVSSIFLSYITMPTHRLALYEICIWIQVRQQYRSSSKTEFCELVPSWGAWCRPPQSFWLAMKLIFGIVATWTLRITGTVLHSMQCLTKCHCTMYSLCGALRVQLGLLSRSLSETIHVHRCYTHSDTMPWTDIALWEGMCSLFSKDARDH
jgi:hypothetical protein